MFTMHACFSKIQTHWPAFGHVATLIKNRQLFSWGVCWTRIACSLEISAFMLFKTQNGLVNALSDRKKKLWFESYCVTKFKKLQNQLVWGRHNNTFLAALHEYCPDLDAIFKYAQCDHGEHKSVARIIFFCDSKKSGTRDMCEMACFSVTGKRPCAPCCATAAQPFLGRSGSNFQKSSILRLEMC